MFRPNESRVVRAVVKNFSEDKIEILSVRTSCSCASAFVDGSTTIEPGKEAAIAGSVNFGLDEGKAEVTIFVKYTDGRNRETELALPVHGTVAAPLVLEKPTVDFGSLDSSDEPRKNVVRIKPGHSGEKWDSINIECDNNNLTAELQNVGLKESELSISLDPAKLPISQFRQLIRLHLIREGKEYPYTPTLTVIARIKGAMSASPQSTYLGLLEPNMTVERFVDISSQALDLTALAVDGESPLLKAQLLETSKNTARIKVRLVAPAAPGAFCEKLRVWHKESGVALCVPFVGAVK